MSCVTSPTHYTLWLRYCSVIYIQEVHQGEDKEEGTVQYNTVRYGTVQYSMVRYVSLILCVSNASSVREAWHWGYTENVDRKLTRKWPKSVKTENCQFLNCHFSLSVPPGRGLAGRESEGKVHFSVKSSLFDHCRHFPYIISVRRIPSVNETVSMHAVHDLISSHPIVRNVWNLV